MIKQQLTIERARRIKFSLQKMAIFSQMLLLENQCELDVDFRIPVINNFAKRIISDSKVISEHLKKSGRIAVNVIDTDFAEDYSGEIWRVVTLLAGMDLEVIKEYANNLDTELKTILTEV